jgi:8-oxo-dGTP diphosphatase
MPVAVYGVLSMGGKTLFMRRAGSGYHDGELALPAGHVDGGEDAVAARVRELREELLGEASPVSCHLATLLHSAPEYEGDSEYINLFFLVSNWSGQPEIGEPGQCTELVWADSALLPDVVPWSGLLSRPSELANASLLMAGRPNLQADNCGGGGRSLNPTSLIEARPGHRSRTGGRASEIPLIGSDRKGNDDTLNPDRRIVRPMPNRRAAMLLIITDDDHLLMHHRDDKPGIAHPDCWAGFGGAVE